MIETWQKDRRLAEKKLNEVWANSGGDESLYLIAIDLGNLDYVYHIIPESDYKKSAWHDAKFIRSIGGVSAGVSWIRK